MATDFRLALRQCLKSPGFTGIVVLMLALGIGANTALFTIVEHVLIRPLPYDEHERLVTLWESQPARGVEQQRVSSPAYREWQNQTRSFENLAFWTGPFEFNLVTEAGTEKAQATYSASSLFPILRVQPVLGRGHLPEDDRKEGPQTAVISDRFWHEKFGASPFVTGKTLTVDTFGRRTYTIVGVMPPGFHFPGDTDLWLSAGWNGLPADRWAGHWLNVIARMKPGVSIEEARAEMNTVQARIASGHPHSGVGSMVATVSLLRQSVDRNTRTALLVLWGSVAGVLLIACANVANLLLARASGRKKEMAIRLAMGAGRWRVMRQLLAECIVLALLSGTLGVLFGYGGLKAFVAANPANIPRLDGVAINAPALTFTLGAALLTALVFGLAPARHASSLDLDQTLREGARGSSVGRATARLRRSLVIAEVALALVLLAGAGLMMQSLAKLLTVPRGFRTEQVLTAELDFSVSGFTSWIRPSDTRPQVHLRALIERLRQLPSVQSVGAAYRFFRRDNHPPEQTFTILGRPIEPVGSRPVAEPNAITPGYLETVGMVLLRGRDFTESDSLEAPGVVLVNEAFVRRYFPNEDPLGKHVTLEKNPGPLGTTNSFGQAVWSEIIGVVGDVRSLSTQPGTVPEILRPYWQWPMQSPVLFVRATGQPADVASSLRREIRAAIPNLPPPEIRTLKDCVGESVSEPRFLAGLLGLLAGLAWVLAGAGVYGLMAYTVSQRQLEIGVRLALGAQRQDVVRLFILQALKLGAAGVGLGCLVAVALSQTLRSLLFEVAPTDPMTLTGASLVLIGTTLVACWIPARTAAATDAMTALHQE